VIKKLGLVSAVLLAPLVIAPVVHSENINKEVARAYNEGVVRCANPECAKYLYACFRSYAATTIDEFLVCGTQASRLNDDQPVVVVPAG